MLAIRIHYVRVPRYSLDWTLDSEILLGSKQKHLAWWCQCHCIQEPCIQYSKIPADVFSRLPKTTSFLTWHVQQTRLFQAKSKRAACKHHMTCSFAKCVSPPTLLMASWLDEMPWFLNTRFVVSVFFIWWLNSTASHSTRKLAWLLNKDLSQMHHVVSIKWQKKASCDEDNLFLDFHVGLQSPPFFLIIKKLHLIKKFLNISFRFHSMSFRFHFVC